MADVDPEVERLADALARTPTSVAPTQTDMARIILADLRERYVMVPRDLWDQVTTGHVEIRRLEPADAPLSAQNGPDDSQAGGGSCSDS